MYVERHQCHYGLETYVNKKNRETGPTKKPTGFMSNNWCLMEELQKKCGGEQIHVALMGGRAQYAAQYPKASCEAMRMG